jgi:predicted  nucleic acid-binding Zn-ribbon protein
MIKRAILVGTGVGLTSLVLFGRDAASYVKTSYHRVTSTVQDRVPVDFQIDRAKQMVRDLDPEIRNSMHVIAKEEVAVDQLNQQITGNQDKADKEKKDILHLQADLGQNKSVYQYASHTYSSDEVKQDLARRFSRFKVADDTLGSMKQMRDARQKNLEAAQQKLSAMINARRKLEVDIQNLEAKRKLVEVAQASSDYVFDDSQLARAKELINDIRTRLDVAAKLANADVNVQTEIPLDEAAPQDITDQVTQYFKLDDKSAKVAKSEPAKETEVTPVSLAHE